MTQITIRLSAQEKKVLAKYTLDNDLTVSQIVRSLIRKYLKEIHTSSSRLFPQPIYHIFSIMSISLNTASSLLHLGLEYR